MDLKEIYKPISFELELVKENIKKQLEIEDENLKKILFYSFQKEGKFFRPALVILSAKAICKKNSSNFEKKLINLATCMELIHNASLIHDDIIDYEIERRGQMPLYRKYNNQIAVLTGDFLYSKAISLLLELPRKILKLVCEATFRMCLGQLQEKNVNGDLNKYLKMIENKTAFFISTCCKAGGILACGKNEQVKNLGEFGLYLGLSYQINDDLIDQNGPIKNLEFLINSFSEKANQSIKSLDNTVYKEKMIELVDYLLSKKVIKYE